MRILKWSAIKPAHYKYKANPKFKDLNDATHAIQQRGINPLEYNKYQYNDANYLILSKVIETVTHKSYMQNLNERLVKPYNLEYTARYSNLNFQKYFFWPPFVFF